MPPPIADGAPTIVSLRGTLQGRVVRIARLDGPRVSAALLDEARASGHSIALVLTSESGGGPGALEREGFRPLPCSEAACRTVLPVPWPKEPAWLREGSDPLRSVPGLRAAAAGDREALASIHEETMALQRLRIDRDRAAWEGLLETRGRPGGGGKHPRAEEETCWLIERDGRVAAYVLLGPGRPTLRWREHGARHGSEDLLADLFWSVLARARAAGAQRIEGWCMPDVLTVQPLYPTSDRGRKGGIPMLKSLDPAMLLPALSREDECRVWEPDALPDSSGGASSPSPAAPSAASPS